MGVFNRFKKESNIEIAKAESIDGSLSLEEAERRVKSLYEQETVYILLSTKQANYLTGMSVPYICQLKENQKKGIILFSKEDYARRYVEQNQFEILDGIYPIGMIQVSDKIAGLDSIISIANAMQVDFMEYNIGFDDDTIGCSVQWFMDVNHITAEVSVVMSEEGFKQVQDNSLNGTIQVHFNPMPICHFDDKYALDSARSKEILSHVFECSSSDKAFEIFVDETLFECCHTSDYICTRMIPMAEKNGKEQDVEFFKNVLGVLNMVIVGKLDDQPRLFTLIDPHTKKIMVKNDVAYIIYTDRFKYMGGYEYQELPLKDSVAWLRKESGVNQFFITDGPHGMSLVKIA